MRFEKHRIEWTHDKISRFWDFTSEIKASDSQAFGFQAGDHVAAVINKAISFRKIRNLLDLSCGKGDVLSSCLKYLHPGQCCHGTDFSEKNIQIVNNRFKDSAVFKEAHVVRSYPSSFPDGFFDLVIMTEVVEHLNDQDLDQILNESKRILSTGGFLFISTPNNEELEASSTICPDCGCVFHRWQHVRKWTLGSLREKSAQFGFSPILCKPMAWSASLKKRVMLKLAVKLNLVAPNGLVYIGKKKT
jgi:2-polyprenyl-3-methyl-5-hydroxy-6-metoxy-1,4-benzoquinol methylase